MARLIIIINEPERNINDRGLTRYRVFVLALKGILQQLHELIEANVPRDRELLPAIFVRALEMNVAVKVLLAAVEHVDRLNG